MYFSRTDILYRYLHSILALDLLKPLLNPPPHQQVEYPFPATVDAQFYTVYYSTVRDSPFSAVEAFL